MNPKYLLLALVLSTIGQITNAQTFEWAKRMGGTDREEGRAIAVDAQGNVYTTGVFKGTVDFDPGPGTFDLISAGINFGDIFISKLDVSGDLVWAKRLGGTGSNIGFSIAVDASGNVYTTGTFQGEADFDPGDGIFNLVSTGFTNAFVSKLDASGNFVWAKQIEGTQTTIGHSIAVDASGNVYTTGSFRGTADFDPGADTFNLSSVGGSSDIFISKLDASGNFVWAKRLGGTGSNGGFSIAVDASGNVYTTGEFVGTADFDPGADTFELSSAGSGDIFISKLDAAGNFVWAKQMGGTASDQGYSIALDASGNVYTTGSFRGIADFDPGADTFNLSSVGGSSDIFISKLDASGNFVWAKQMGGIGSGQGRAIALDASGDIYTTGSFSATADFNPGADVFNLFTTGDIDIFISKLDTLGNFVWAKQMGGTDDDVGLSIAIDTSGNIHTTGVFQSTADFDPGDDSFNLSSAGGFDVFVHKMSQNTTGLSVNFFDGEITVYPNPTSGPINIALGENIATADVILRNYLGQEVLRKSYTSTNMVELTIEGPAGLYLLEIRGNDKKVVAKIIKY